MFFAVSLVALFVVLFVVLVMLEENRLSKR
jgi:hypothetical protein